MASVMEDKYDVCVIGLGPVVTVSARCFAKMGLRVIGVDSDLVRVNTLMKGESPFVEPLLDELVRDVRQSGFFHATLNLDDAVRHSPVVMIAVGTPTPRNAPDLSQLDTVCEQIGEALKDKPTPTVIAVRSTIPPGTIRQRLSPIVATVSGKRKGIDFHMVSNPEFLREGMAINDFFKTSRVIVGADSDYAAECIEALYKDVDADEHLRVAIESAEFAKYVDNTWHALKVSFANEIGRVCMAAGGKVEETTHIFLTDKRLNISECYLKPGFAFGGSCLPKDVRGLSYLAGSLGVSTPVINAILPSNEEHIALGMEAILENSPKDVGILGVAFKEQVDDLRESPALAIASELMEHNINVKAHDPAYTPGETLYVPRSGRALNLMELETLVASSDTLVLMHRLPIYRSITNRYRNTDKHIIDLTTLPKTSPLFSKKNGKTSGEKNFQATELKSLIDR